MAAVRGVDYYIDNNNFDAYRYIWNNVPALTSDTNYAFVPAAPNANDVSLSKVEELPDDETITDDDGVEFQKAQSHKTVVATWREVKSQIGTGGGGATGPSKVTETAKRINAAGNIAMSGGATPTANVVLTESMVGYDEIEIRGNNNLSVRVDVGQLSLDNFLGFDGFVLDRGRIGHVKANSATSITVQLENNVSGFTITGIFGIKLNSVGGSGITSYAALPTSVINGNIIAVVGDGFYKGIAGVWVRSKQIAKETSLYSNSAGQQAPANTNTNFQLTGTYAGYTHYKVLWYRVASEDDPIPLILALRGSEEKYFRATYPQSSDSFRTLLKLLTSEQSNTIRFVPERQIYIYGFFGINYSQGWDA